ncbi:MAG: class I SAM-dependent methyltransferase [bacterium]|nr:class I SAM-dependent methyltransferase [bacterium]
MSKSNKQHWNQIYADKDPLQVSWYQSEPLSSLRLIERSGLQKDEALIDIGGGASVLVDRLQVDGFSRLAVLDISKKALSIVRQRLKKGAGRVDWFETDITQFRPPHQFSLWHDRAVFHFLTKKRDRQKYVEVLKNTLRPGGHVIIAAFAIGGPRQCSGLDIVQYDASGLLGELGQEFELVEEQSEMHITPSKKKQKFSYFWMIKK